MKGQQRRRHEYTLKVDDIDPLGGGDIVVEDWPGGVRILLGESRDVGPHRANLVLSRQEARRLARQIAAFAEQRS